MMVWAGSNLSGFGAAERALFELAGLSISDRRVRRATEQIGAERVAERTEAVERFREMDLPKQRAGSQADDPPQIGVISLDGGRYQRRDHFGDKDRPPGSNHWKEDKVGCLLSMSGRQYAVDPAPDFPDWLAGCSAVAELAKIAEKTGVFEASPDAANRRRKPKPATRGNKCIGQSPTTKTIAGG